MKVPFVKQFLPPVSPSGNKIFDVYNLFMKSSIVNFVSFSGVPPLVLIFLYFILFATIFRYSVIGIYFFCVAHIPF